MRGLNLLTVMIVMGATQLGLAASSKGNAKAGEKIYIQSCQICHGPMGRGNSDMAAYLTSLPDLSSSTIQDKTDATLLTSILEGHGTGMWSYAGVFENDELADIMAYIRSLKR